MIRSVLFSIKLLLCVCVFSNALQAQNRVEQPIEFNAVGKVSKTYDGYLYRIYDTLGRMVEYYGNPRFPDFDENVHFFIYYNKKGRIYEVRTYTLEDDNVECVIKDSLDYVRSLFFYRGKKLVLHKIFRPIYDNTGKVIGQQLHQTITRNPQCWYYKKAPKARRK